MYVFEHTIYQLKQEVGDELIWSHALQYPEINRFSESAGAQPQFDQRLKELSEETDAESFGQRVLANDPQIAELTIKIAPAKKVSQKRFWVEPIELNVPYVAWQRNDQLVSAFVPGLGLHVTREGKMDPKFVGDLRVEIRSALIRSGMLNDLTYLPRIGEFGSLELVESKQQIRLPSAKQVAMAEPDEQEKEELPVVATRIDEDEGSRKGKRGKPDPMPGFHIEDRVEKLAEMMGEPEKLSVLLVGPVGVGKTQTVLELARRKTALGFSGQQFWETSGSRIVAGMSGFGQWQQRLQKILEDLKKRSGILLVGNLAELLEVGRSNNQSQTVASWMQPQIQRGSLQVVAECTPEQLSIIEQREPQLLSALTVMRIERPDEALQKKIFGSAMEYLLTHLGRQQGNVLSSDDGLDAIYRLHHRYATYSANPGRPLQFMQRLVEDASSEAEKNEIAEIDAGFVSRAFSAQTGLPEFLLDREQSLNLQEIDDWFSRRVIGQPVPVETVVDLVATVKAGLSPIGKPIASLMFIGPTGVGKTEMAKSLAEFMFSSQRRLLRFDMSEFGDSLSVQRLIGGTGEKEGLLTGKIKQHPFSVVLFDEFEKAHPAFMDLLLQVLGEGRLTDGLGRTTDFSTTIVVITSNLGAEQFKPVSFGFSDPNEQPEVSDRRYEDHFVQQVRQRLRPELFNRIDRIVPFRPLQLDTVKQIVRREIDKLKRREGIWHRGVEVEISDETCDALASSSLDLRYGARPIQRLLHDKVTIPLSEKLASFSQQQRVRVKVELDADDQRVRIQAKGIEAKQPSSRALVTLVQETQALRRKSHRLSAGDATLRLQNEMYQRMQAADRNGRRIKKLQRKDHLKNASEIDRLESENRKLEVEIAEFKHFVDKAIQVHHKCCQFEEQQLMRYFEQENIDIDAAAQQRRTLEQEVKQVIFENFLFESKGGGSVTLLIWTSNKEIRKGLVDGYLDFAKQYDLRATGYWIVTHDSNTPNEKVTTRLKNRTDDVVVYDVYHKPVQDLFNDSAETIWGIGLKFVGPAAYPMFGYEGGRHLFKSANTRDAAVEVIGEALSEHTLSDEVLSSGPYDGVTIQRTYNLQRHLVEDRVTKKMPFEEGSSIRKIVSMSVERALQHHLDKYIE